MRSDAEAFGLAAPAQGSDDLVLLPEHADAVRLFTHCLTQWRVAGMSGVVMGLDYSACRQVADAMDIDWRENLWRLQVMELEGRKCLSEKRK